PVTEEITGQDLVEWQLRVASGEKLPLKQEELRINGWAMEARLYAENPETGFLPSTGELAWFIQADRHDYEVYPVRRDSAVEPGSEVTPYYDPMLAKFIAHGATRAEAIARLRNACAACEAAPVKTNAGFLVRCLSHPRFAAGDVDTGLIAADLDRLVQRPPADEAIASLAAKKFAMDAAMGRFTRRASLSREATRSPWAQLEGFRLNARRNALVHMIHEGKSYAALPERDWDSITSVDGVVYVFREGDAYEFHLDTGERADGEAAANDGAILSPMPGKIVSVAAKAGARLKKGDPILVLEAMKMEHTLTAPFDGKLAELNAKPGAQVSEGVLLAKLEAAT
ncbi:MAG TPA: biotin/lipoyl-containing protein, partial [Candidatus Binatia bacterium]|nr:biotin/lipoyl-containing protein [Candidatus Binatia bacterium]